MKNNNKIIVISGPTASGKSAFAIELAKKLDGVIVNADSIQIYEGLPILSAQPDDKDKKEAEHRLYNIIKPKESNCVFNWLQLAKKNVDEILEKGQTPILVGGTGMYISRFINGIRPLPDTNMDNRNKINSLYEEIGWDKFYDMVKEVDEESVLKIKKNDKHKLIKTYEVYEISGKKLSYFESLPNELLYDRQNIFHINIMPKREDTYRFCEIRFKIMVEKLGVIEEVKNFLKNNEDVFNSNSSILHTIGLMEIKEYLEGKIDYDTMLELSIKDTRNYAKRQFTWFKNQFTDVNVRINTLINSSTVADVLKNTLESYNLFISPKTE